MKNTHRGMALIEVLVSLLLFSFGVLGLIGLEARSVSFSVDAEDRNRAALLANEIASSMWLTGSVAVNAATWQAQVSNTSAGGVPGGTVTINAVAGTTNSADIAITWTAPHASNTSSLT